MGKKKDNHAAEKPINISYGDYTLDQARFDKLITVSNKQEQTTLKVLYNAVVKAVNNMNSGTGNTKDWELTRNSYEKYSAELWNKYFPSAPAASEPVLKTIQDVIRRVNEMGYKLAKSAYNHADRGLLRPNDEGIYTQDIIDKYILQANIRKKDGSKKSDREKVNSERNSAEIRRIIALADHEECKLNILKGKYVLKESLVRELSYRLSVFKMDGESSCRTKAGARINVIIAGLEDQMLAWAREKFPEQVGLISEAVKAVIGFMREKTPDVIEFDLNEFSAWLNRYSAARDFEVPQPAGQNDTDPEVDTDTDDEIREEAELNNG